MSVLAPETTRQRNSCVIAMRSEAYTEIVRGLVRPCESVGSTSPIRSRCLSRAESQIASVGSTHHPSAGQLRHQVQDLRSHAEASKNMHRRFGSPTGLTFIEELEATRWEVCCKKFASAVGRNVLEPQYIYRVEKMSSSWQLPWGLLSYRAKLPRVKKRYSELGFTTAAPSSTRTVLITDDV